MNYQKVMDTTGTCVSLACAVHCLLLPLFITLLPFIGLTFLIDEKVELGLILTAVALVTASLIKGIRQHRQWYIFIFLVGAGLCFYFGHTLETSYQVLFHGSVGLFLAGTHLLNNHLCKKCEDC